jgi:hypothetical protein
MNRSIYIWVAALVLWTAPLSYSQEKAPAAAPNDKALSLELIAAPVKPGEPVFVNAMLANPGGERVRVIHQTIQFPREKLVFVQARLGIAADLADSTLALVMKDKSGAKTTSKDTAQSLDLTVTGKKTFQDGPFIELEFRLADNKEQTIKISHTADALDDQGKKIAGMTFADAQLIVSNDTAGPPAAAIGCFFFTH